MSVHEKKRAHEKKMLIAMMACYARHHREYTDQEEMKGLLEYALNRLDQCPKIETKTFCSRCEIKCYSKDMQEKIRKVMRFSGKRMLGRHPLLVLKHLIRR